MNVDSIAANAPLGRKMRRARSNRSIFPFFPILFTRRNEVINLRIEKKAADYKDDRFYKLISFIGIRPIFQVNVVNH